MHQNFQHAVSTKSSYWHADIILCTARLGARDLLDLKSFGCLNAVTVTLDTLPLPVRCGENSHT